MNLNILRAEKKDSYVDKQGLQAKVDELIQGKFKIYLCEYSE